MPSAARAYASQRAPRRSTPIRVVSGKRRTNTLSPFILLAARVFVIVVAVFALVACMRIGLASATVTTSIETERLNAQVEQVRSGSAHLEVAESALANPTAVKETAVKKLKMSAPYETDVVSLEADVVAFDEEGNLSLARSLSRSTHR